LVENGLGLAVVPRLTLPHTPSVVVGVKLEKPTIHRTIGLIRRTGRTLSPAAAAFAKLVTNASKATQKALAR
jgi:DNA-binding transcriptional LysR family regulator